MSTSLTCLDLFCGCGGFSLGMKRAGFNVLAAIDFNKRSYHYLQGEFSKGNDGTLQRPHQVSAG